MVSHFQFACTNYKSWTLCNLQFLDDKRTALHLAAELGQLDIVKFLIEHGRARVDIQDVVSLCDKPFLLWQHPPFIQWNQSQQCSACNFIRI
jgi:hypothetical protein